MIRTGVAALFLLLSASAEQAPQPPRVEGSLIIQHRQIIVRVPSAIREIAPPGASLMKWRESRGPHCISAARLLGATLMRQSSVDLILRDNSRIRAQLQRRCPALDYYRGFYINTTEDGRICADRDSIHSRAGGECQIDAFRTLTPDRP